MIETINTEGIVEFVITNEETGEIVLKEKKNTVLTIGKSILARTLANDLTSLVYVSHMVFGQGGESGNIPRVVDPGRSSLFNSITGTQVAVASGWSSDYPTRVTFSASLGSSIANGYVINEAALQLSNGDLFSMITFGGLTKTSSLSFTLNWTIILS